MAAIHIRSRGADDRVGRRDCGHRGGDHLVPAQRADRCARRKVPTRRHVRAAGDDCVCGRGASYAGRRANARPAARHRCRGSNHCGVADLFSDVCSAAGGERRPHDNRAVCHRHPAAERDTDYSIAPEDERHTFRQSVSRADVHRCAQAVAQSQNSAGLAVRVPG